jgi:hypothetical protein
MLTELSKPEMLSFKTKLKLFENVKYSKAWTEISEVAKYWISFEWFIKIRK